MSQQRRAYTPDERQRFAEAYCQGGLPAARRVCPDRTDGALSVLALRMGLRHARSWSPAEHAVLRLLYPLVGPAGMQPYLPGRTHAAVHCEARRLRLRHAARWWRDDERAAVTRAYARGGAPAVRDLGLVRGASLHALVQVADSVSPRSWTSAELRTLRKAWARGGWQAAAQALPHRTPVAVRARGRALHLLSPAHRPRWDALDRQMLCRLVPQVGVAEAARRMSWHSQRSVRAQAAALGLLGARDARRVGVVADRPREASL